MLLKKIKILGICHGAQFIAKKFGLKLNKIKNHVGEHQIKLIFKNKIFEKKVNSFHEMGIKKIKIDTLISLQYQMIIVLKVFI